MSHAAWYATRGTGVVALGLLTIVVALGIAGSLRLRSDRWPRFLVLGLHRNVTLLAVVVLAGHVGTTIVDSYTPIGLQDAFVPFIGRYRPVWLGLGAVAFDLLLALTVTSLLRSRLGYRSWRAIHWLAYAAWPVALAHGLGTGSDARFGWMQAVSAGCVALVLAALASRLGRSTAEPVRRLLAGAAAAALAVTGVVWYVGGPGAHGWARRAGTPVALLKQPVAKPIARVAVRRTARDTAASRLPTVPFAVPFSGRLTTAQQNDGLLRIDIRGRTRDGAGTLLWVRLEGQATVDGGVAMTASGVRFGPTGAPNLYTGSVVQLEGTHVRMRVRSAGGRHLSLDVRLAVDEVTSTVTGTLRVAGGGPSE